MLKKVITLLTIMVEAMDNPPTNAAQDFQFSYHPTTRTTFEIVKSEEINVDAYNAQGD